jgi:two-component system nitrogen regulation sensor histidine kinase NtrY
MQYSRSQFLGLSSFFLMVWFRFEKFFHAHALFNILAPIISLSLIVVLWKSARGKSRYVIGALWLLITAILIVDCGRSLFYSDFSQSAFEKKIAEESESVRRRSLSQVEFLRNGAESVKHELDAIDILSPSSVFLALENHLSQTEYGWAVYDNNGDLLAWKGEFPSRETHVTQNGEDITVYTTLHQQFIRLKKDVQAKHLAFIVVVNRRIAADYGFRNRYLKDYNLLTDRLSIRPDLLYNSQVSAPPGSDLIIKTFRVNPDLSISTLFKKHQYLDYLRDVRFRVHWWFELAALLYLLFGIIYCFFDFVGVAGTSSSAGALARSWVWIFFIGVFGLTLVSEFSAFGISTMFQAGSGNADAWQRFRTPGGLFLASFFTLNILSGFAIFLAKCCMRLNWKFPLAMFVTVLITAVLAGFLIQNYMNFIKTMVLNGWLDLMELGTTQTDVLKVAQRIGTLWTGLSFLILLGILFWLGFSVLSERNIRNCFKMLPIQILAGAVFWPLFKQQGTIPFMYAIILYFGMSGIVFFLPQITGKLSGLNLLSRFLIILLSFSLASFIFHLIRFHYAADLRKEFVEQAAGQVQNQNQFIQTILTASQSQLDQALVTLTIDPKIPDLAFRLWARTDLARFGLRSALEIYDEEGRLVNRFSVSLPRLAVPILDVVLERGWATERRTVILGNVRKSVHFAVRDIPDVGFVVIEVAQDYESLPFMTPSSPFRELFRFRGAFQNMLTPDLNVYDAQWRPVFVSRADLSLSTQQGQDLLRESSSGWVHEKWSGRALNVYYFRITDGFAGLILPAATPRGHVVRLIELLLINLLWLSAFALVFIIFFRQYLVLHFPTQTMAGFNFFQKLLIAFVVFSMVPIVSFSLVMRNYAWEKKVQEVTSRALDSFSVATKVVGDYLFYRAEERDVPRQQLFSNELLEWIGQVIQQDVSFYYNRYLLASSDRELYSAGLLPEQMSGQSYVDLFLKGQKYSINEATIGTFHFLNVSGRIYTGRYRDEVITIPFLLDERSIQEETNELREYMILVGAGLVLLAVLLGYFLANRFSKPVEVLIHGTGEMSRGNLQYRIREKYRDEFRQLVTSFNAMAQSLDQQKTALERRRAYIENILNNITTAVVSVENTMKVATSNPAAANLLHMSPAYRGELTGIMPDSMEWRQAREALREFLEQRERFSLREVSVLRGGQAIHLRLVYVPLFSENHWNGALLLVEDITDIIRSNRLSAWAEMARRVAHEVKNPLTPIQLSMEHLMKVYRDRSADFSSVLQECNDTILKQVKALRILVSDFSVYGRPGALNLSDVNMESFLKDLIASYPVPEGIVLETHVASGLPKVRIDADKIRGAFMNIIENGLQAMNGNGRIIVNADKTVDHSVRVQIIDNGRGVPADVLPRLFEPYFSTKTGGSGLGLAIARKNIEDHGGKIRVESKEGEGTIVTVEIPVS